MVKKEPILLNSGNDSKEVLKNDNLSSLKRYVLLVLTKMTKSDIERDKKHPIQTIGGEIRINIIPYEYNDTKNKLKISNNKPSATVWTDEKKLNLELLKQVCLLYDKKKFKYSLYSINTI